VQHDAVLRVPSRNRSLAYGSSPRMRLMGSSCGLDTLT